MSDRRGTRRSARKFTFEQLRKESSRVIGVAKKDGGCLVVDKDGTQLFGIYFPQPVDTDW